MKTIIKFFIAVIFIISFTGCSKEYVGQFRCKQFLSDQIIEIKSNGDFEFIMNNKSLASGVIKEKNGILTMKLEDGSEIGEFKYDNNKLTSIKQIKGGSFDYELFAKGQVFMREDKK